MRQSIYLSVLFILIGLASAMPLFCQDSISVSTQQEPVKRLYTKDSPLVFEDAIDLWPYSFRAENGEDMGYNIDLLHALMEKLSIPYIVRLKERREVLNDLKARRADLTYGMDAHFHNTYGKYGKSIVHLFTHSVVWPVDKPQRIFIQDDLGKEKVMVHDNSFSHNLMITHGWQDNAIPLKDMKQAILQLSEDENGQMLWNTASLKSLIHMYHIENLQIAPVDMSDGEYKFMSNDEALLARIDSAYNILDAEGRLASLQSKWFYPDVQETGIPSWIWNVLNTGVVLTFLLILYGCWAYFRLRKALKQAKMRTSRLALIMHTSGLSIWLFDINKRLFTWLDKDGAARQQYPISQMVARVGSENLARITACLDKLERLECETAQLEVTTFAESNPTGGDRIYVIDFSVLRRERGKPSIIIAVCSDVYDERKKQQEAFQRLSRYRSVFNTALVDMIYFDQNGLIADMNERAQRTFRMPLQEAVRQKLGLKQMLGLDEIDYNNLDYYYSTMFVTPDGKPTHIKTKGAMAYEMQLVPIYNALGYLQCVYGTGRDVTETVTTYRALQESINEVRQATQKVTDYGENINYVMGVGGVRMAYYSQQSHTLTIYKSLDVVQHTLTQSRCMTLVNEVSKKTAMRMLNSMDSLTTQSIEAEIMTTLRIGGKPLYLQFRFVPAYDNDNKITGYFGLCRDTSELKETEQLLTEQTKRAQEVEDLKNSFLRNMSYEIRTPLNAVVGFAELFELDHSPEDEELFIQEIKHNSAHLLNLINDILFLSRLDAHMIELDRQPVDFAQTFEGHCHIGWSPNQKEGVNLVVENRYDQLIVEIDDANIGRVIEQLVANAAQHTEEGTVKARYDYMNGQLIIAIEDTGVGMSKERLSHIYERFNTGAHQDTGLGLPICKELTEQMGGTIEITSVEGKGTTAWITIPAVATVVDRKKGI